MHWFYIDSSGVCREKSLHRLLRLGHIAVGVLYMLVILGALNLWDYMKENG